MKDERGRGYREEMKKKKHRSVGEGGNKYWKSLDKGRLFDMDSEF